MSRKQLPANVERIRPSDLLERDRARVAELATAEHYTQGEIAAILTEETGRLVTPRQIGHDLKVIRERWLVSQKDNYNNRIEQELLRLDAVERNAWQAWRDSKKPVVTRVSRNSGKYSTDEVSSKDSVGDPRFLDIITKVQSERRKLLDLYPNSKAKVGDTGATTKAYYFVSPMTWPGASELNSGEEIVDGQVIEPED